MLLADHFDHAPKRFNAVPEPGELVTLAEKEPLMSDEFKDRLIRIRTVLKMTGLGAPHSTVRSSAVTFRANSKSPNAALAGGSRLCASG